MSSGSVTPTRTSCASEFPIPTRAGARTSFFSADLNEFYLAMPLQGEREAEIRVFQPQN